MRALDISGYLIGLVLLSMLSNSHEAIAMTSFGSGDAVGGESPYLLSPPRVAFTPSALDPSRYDVTITLEAAGPRPIYDVALWVFSAEDVSVFASLKLQPVGGNSWSVTSDPSTPLAAGNYYIDDILIEDGDHASAGLVGSGSYRINDFFSTAYYVSDQRQTDWSTGAIPRQHIGITKIPLVHFAMP